MKNLKISAKILVSFAIVVVMAVALGAGSIAMVGSVGDVANSLASETVPSLSNLWIARRAILQCQECAVEATIVMSPEDLQLIEDNLTNARNTMETALQDLEKTMPEFRDDIEQISAVVQSTSATAEQSAAASEELSGQANVLKELIGRFQLDTENANPVHHSDATAFSAAETYTAPAASCFGDKY